MTYAANDVVLGRHLDTAEKRIKREIDKIVTSGASIAVFTGATAVDGTSGLVPAPLAGDNGKFLRGDGVWATVESGSSGGGAGYVIGSNVSGVEGGFWQDMLNDEPVLKLRHGDYEYNFAYDNLSYIGGASSVLETVTPNTYVLGTASVSNDGGVWYEVDANNVPTLNLHAGNFNYGFNYDSITYKGGNSHLAAYLPLNVSPTADACGNTWTATGNPAIIGGALSLDGSSCVVNSTISDSIGARTLQPWTIDFWATATSSTNQNGFFGTFNALNPNANGQWVCVVWNGGNPLITFYGNDHVVNLNLQLNTRHHYALTYDGTNVYFFADGVLGKTVALPVQLGGDFVIGARPIKDLPFIGTIDHFRISTRALWTEDFTPPTAEDYL